MSVDPEEGSSKLSGRHFDAEPPRKRNVYEDGQPNRQYSELPQSIISQERAALRKRCKDAVELGEKLGTPLPRCGSTDNSDSNPFNPWGGKLLLCLGKTKLFLLFCRRLRWASHGAECDLNVSNPLKREMFCRRTF